MPTRWFSRRSGLINVKCIAFPIGKIKGTAGHALVGRTRAFPKARCARPDRDCREGSLIDRKSMLRWVGRGSALADNEAEPRHIVIGARNLRKTLTGLNHKCGKLRLIKAGPGTQKQMEDSGPKRRAPAAR
jgi:hypothetical protein